jgi:hypothetical protein
MTVEAISSKNLSPAVVRLRPKFPGKIHNLDAEPSISLITNERHHLQKEETFYQPRLK